MSTDELKYPIGRMQPQERNSAAVLAYREAIEQLPAQLEYALINLDAAQLHTPYRPGGWTVHQLVHHIADSHMNAFIRFKLCLTEDNPVIKPYDENAWVQLADVSNVPVNYSTTLLHALHKRWTSLVDNVQEQDWMRTVVHPEYNREMSLWHLLQLYAWHGRHHVAHIKALRHREDWW